MSLELLDLALEVIADGGQEVIRGEPVLVGHPGGEEDQEVR